VFCVCLKSWVFGVELFACLEAGLAFYLFFFKGPGLDGDCWQSLVAGVLLVFEEREQLKDWSEGFCPVFSFARFLSCLEWTA